MGKVKITQEQADAVEALINSPHVKFKYAIETARNLEWGSQEFKPLNELSFDKFIRVIRYGYEVEPKFKKGDWVVHEYTGKVRVISKMDPGPFMTYVDFDGGLLCGVSIEGIRHATPQEITTEKTRRWWERHDRDVWELKKGDIIRKFVINGDVYEVTHHDGDYIELFNLFSLTRETEEIDIVSGGYRVMCFARDRKDI